MTSTTPEAQFHNADEWHKLKQGVMDLAKQEILPRYEKVSAERKADGSLLTEADTEMQKATAAFLQENWPQFAFLGEESTEEEQITALASDQGCWIIDPLDGTNNFASGIPIFSTAVSLVIKGDVVLGMVYDCYRDELFAARKGLGAELNHQPLLAEATKEKLSQCIGIIDVKRISDELLLRLLKNGPMASQRNLGSGALDWCWVAAGRGQVYCHGAQNIWDYAAGYLILNEAGGASSTLTGEVVLRPKVVKRSIIAATTPAIFEEWQTQIKQLNQ